jgi:ClpP class serine protease
MKYITQLLPLILCISCVTSAMEAPEKSLSEELERKCSVSPHISRKRANSTLLDSNETYSTLLQAVMEKRAKRHYEMQVKIKNGDLIPYRIGVDPAHFDDIYTLDATIKRIVYNPHQQGLATVDLLVMVDKEHALITNPIVKTYMRLLKYENMNN